MRSTLRIDVIEFFITFLAAVFVPFLIGLVLGFILAGGRI